MSPIEDRTTTRAGTLEWRRLTATLWVGIGPWGVVGSVELGRTWVVSDGAGAVYGRFHSLEDAKAMLELLHERGEAGPHPERVGTLR